MISRVMEFLKQEFVKAATSPAGTQVWDMVPKSTYGSHLVDTELPKPEFDVIRGVIMLLLTYADTYSYYGIGFDHNICLANSLDTYYLKGGGFTPMFVGMEVHSEFIIANARQGLTVDPGVHNTLGNLHLNISQPLVTRLAGNDIATLPEFGELARSVLKFKTIEEFVVVVREFTDELSFTSANVPVKRSPPKACHMIGAVKESTTAHSVYSAVLEDIFDRSVYKPVGIKGLLSVYDRYIYFYNGLQPLATPMVEISVHNASGVMTIRHKYNCPCPLDQRTAIVRYTSSSGTIIDGKPASGYGGVQYVFDSNLPCWDGTHWNGTVPMNVPDVHSFFTSAAVVNELVQWIALWAQTDNDDLATRDELIEGFVDMVKYSDIGDTALRDAIEILKREVQDVPVYLGTGKSNTTKRKRKRANTLKPLK